MKQDADRWRGLSRFEFIFTFVFVYAIPGETKAEHRCMQFVRAGDELRIVEVEIEFLSWSDVRSTAYDSVFVNWLSCNDKYDWFVYVILGQ